MPMRKRRRGFPSETNVKRGTQIVHGDKVLEEKLWRNDLCPCGSRSNSKSVARSEAAFDGSNRDEYLKTNDQQS